jgi:regulator of protease activity HflC (stomatin/prohibitin superfamily)
MSCSNDVVPQFFTMGFSKIAIVVAACAAIPLAGCQATVDEGHHGLRIQMYGPSKGARHAQLLSPGRHWYNPLNERVDQWPTTLQRYPYTSNTKEGSAENEAVCFSLGGTEACQDVAVPFRFVPSELPSYYSEYKVDAATFISGFLRDGLRDCYQTVVDQTPSFTEFIEVNGKKAPKKGLSPLDLARENSAVVPKVGQCLQDRFPKLVEIKPLSALAKPRFTAEAIQKAIDEGFAAQQQASSAIQKRVQAENEAAAELARARGKAQAKIAEAQGAQSADVRAQQDFELKKLRVQRWDGREPNTIVNTPQAVINNGK